MLDESVYMEITSPFNTLIGQSTVGVAWPNLTNW